MINHSKKILELAQPSASWFVNAIRYFDLGSLCFVAYVIIKHDMRANFVEGWHSETSYFHLYICDMTITLYDFCLPPASFHQGKINGP